jgi:flagellar protein FlgJ
MEIVMAGNNLIENYTGGAARAVAQAQDDSFAKRLEEAAKNNNDKELKKACQEFEAIILNILYKQMKSTIIKSGLIEEDPGTGIFESMYDEQLMEQASKTGSLGLSELLYRQLSGQYGKTKGK